MRTFIYFTTILLMIACSSSKTDVFTNQHSDSLIIGDKIFYLDSISESDYKKCKYKMLIKEPDTNLIVINPDSIIIKSEAKNVILKNDSTHGESMVTFEFKAIIPQPGYVHIKGFHWEWTTDRYINLKTGFETYFWDNPILSPKKNLVVAYSSDLVAGFMPNGLQLYKITQDTIIKIFEKEITEWGPHEVKWESDSSITIKRVKLDKEYNPSYDYLRMIIK